MKKLIFLTLFLISVVFANAQQQIDAEQVPMKVRKWCYITFPQTQNVTKHPVNWVLTKDGKYKGTLTVYEVPAYILIDSTGNTFKAEYRVQADVLPARVKDYFQNHYPGYEMMEIIRITNEKKNDAYKVKAKVTSTYLFDEDGLFVSEQL